MVKTLVLVRHGNPEPTSETGQDIDRPLTPSGRLALEAVYPNTFSLLGDVSDIELWSSPAVRALETASIVAKAVGIADIEVHDSLYEQDIRKFLNELCEAKPTTVIAVGHVPFVDQLASRIAGPCPAFGKGAVGAFDLPDGPKGSGTLRWFVGAPKAVSWETLACAEREVSDAAELLSQRCEQFIASPESAEALLDFRVSLRQVRSLLQFIEPWQSKKQNRSAQHTLKTLQSISERLRSLDILYQTVCGLVDSGELGDNSLLPVACANERSLECSALVGIMRKNHVAKELRHLSKDLSSLHWKADVTDRGLTAADFQERFDQELDALDEEVFGLDLRDGNAVFVARRDAKEMHYVADCFGDILGPERAVMAEHMDELQEELGALSDARNNKRLADECSKSPRFRGVRADLSVVARDQAEVVSAITSVLERRDDEDEGEFERGNAAPVSVPIPGADETDVVDRAAAAVVEVVAVAETEPSEAVAAAEAATSAELAAKQEPEPEPVTESEPVAELEPVVEPELESASESEPAPESAPEPVFEPESELTAHLEIPAEPLAAPEA